MSDKRQNDLTTTDAPRPPIPAMPPGAALASLAESLKVNLTDEQKARLAPKIAEAQADMAKKADDAEQKLYENSVKMSRAVQYTKAMTTVDVDQTHKFAGDGWESTVTKNSNLVKIIIAIVIGVVAIFVLAR